MINSGLYSLPFFTIYHKKWIKDIDLLEFNEKAFKEYYLEEDDEVLMDKFFEIFDYHPNCFQPLIWNEEIAWKCNLIPFMYDGEHFLSLTGGGMDLKPFLDLYQVLTLKAIDRQSRYFSDREYFEFVVGEELIKKVDKILNKN